MGSSGAGARGEGGTGTPRARNGGTRVRHEDAGRRGRSGPRRYSCVRLTSVPSTRYGHAAVGTKARAGRTETDVDLDCGGGPVVRPGGRGVVLAFTTSA